MTLPADDIPEDAPAGVPLSSGRCGRPVRPRRSPFR